MGTHRAAQQARQAAFLTQSPEARPLPWLGGAATAGTGENPEDFRRLHRDLIAYLRPDDARSRVIVETLAETWWEKMRRVRGWVGAGPCDTKEIDARIDDLVQRLVWALQLRTRKWRWRVESMLGRGLYGPALVRKRLESWVPALGGTPPAVPAALGLHGQSPDFAQRLAGIALDDP